MKQRYDFIFRIRRQYSVNILPILGVSLKFDNLIIIWFNLTYIFFYSIIFLPMATKTKLYLSLYLFAFQCTVLVNDKYNRRELKTSAMLVNRKIFMNTL